MKYTKENLTLEDGLKREWIITNGIGGYASSSIIGANTRRYHGLLIASFTPPARRYLILSKVDESIEIDGNKYNLFTNVQENYISQGFKYQTGFDNDPVPTFTYDVEGIQITKQIAMVREKNIVGVYYKIKNIDKNTKINIAPIVNFRDFHTMNTDHSFELKQNINVTNVKLVIDKNENFPIYFKMSDGKYIEHQNDTFVDMFYTEEENRGFYPKENNAVAGVFEIELKPNETKELSFVCGLGVAVDTLDAKDIITKEKIRLTKLTNSVGYSTEFEKELIKAADQFIVYRPSFELHTIIAGYHWFLDWGRDSLISYEGLLLKTKRYKIAKEVLLTMTKDINSGLVPNGYSGYDNRPLYNSADSSLLLFEQIQKYLNYTGDYKFVKERLYDKLKDVISSYISGINLDSNNIYLDSDYLLVSGTEHTQNTWMDVKCGDIVATPRFGKVVEMNALWYNTLRIMMDLTQKLIDLKMIDNSKENIAYIENCKFLSEKCKKIFNKRFYNDMKKCLYDVINDSKIRPNQLFALSLTYPIIDPNSEKAYNILDTVEKKLLNNYGLKTLAKGELNYTEKYEGDGFKRDMSYHQGITWVWLLGLYYDSLRNMIKFEKRKKYKKELEDKLFDFRKNVEATFSKEINARGCIGSIAEIYDSCEPYEPKGAVAQAWSVAEVYRIIKEEN